MTIPLYTMFAYMRMKDANPILFAGNRHAIASFAPLFSKVYIGLSSFWFWSCCMTDNHSENLVEDFYRAHYVAGLLHRPVFNVFSMSNKSGKSLTTIRMLDRGDILVIPGDTTAQALRNILADAYEGHTFENINLIIVEDFTKIRIKVREGVISILASIAAGMLSIQQQGTTLKPTQTHMSVIVNVPTTQNDIPMHMLIKAGAGNRYGMFCTELSPECKAVLDDVGGDNRCEPVRPLLMPVIKGRLSYKEYKEAHLSKDRLPSDINLGYACEHISPTLYDELVAVKGGIIRKIKWDAWGYLND